MVVDAVSDAHAAAQSTIGSSTYPTSPSGRRRPRPAAPGRRQPPRQRPHAHPAGTRIRTGLAREAGWVKLTVSDNGPGVPSELRPHVFERFARGDTSRNRAGGSTGLGLSIVSAVVAAHGGHVELHTRTADPPAAPGETTFSVLLPTGAVALATTRSGMPNRDPRSPEDISGMPNRPVDPTTSTAETHPTHSGVARRAPDRGDHELHAADHHCDRMAEDARCP